MGTKAADDALGGLGDDSEALQLHQLEAISSRPTPRATHSLIVSIFLGVNFLFLSLPKEPLVSRDIARPVLLNSNLSSFVPQGLMFAIRESAESNGVQI
jgi:hypothetical protein